MLADLGFVSPDQVEQARQEAANAGVGVVDLLVANKLIRPEDVTQAKAAHFGVEMVTLGTMQIPDDVIGAVRRDIARKYRVVPTAQHDGALTIAISDPSDLATVDTLQHLLHAEINLQVAAEADIEAALSKYYGGRGDSRVEQMIQDITKGEVEIAAVGELAGATDGAVVEADAPLIKLVNQIIIEAFKLRASDIHLEPLAK